MIPKIVIVLVLSATSTREHFWYPSQVYETMQECREGAPTMGETDAHGFPVQWKCIEYRRR